MRRVTCVSLHALRVKLCVDLHLCSRMRSFDVYYTTVIVCCQVFVTVFLKVFLRKFFRIVSIRAFTCVGVVSIVAFVFGGVAGFCWV